MPKTILLLRTFVFLQFPMCKRTHTYPNRQPLKWIIEDQRTDGLNEPFNYNRILQERNHSILRLHKNSFESDQSNLKMTALTFQFSGVSIEI